jgi:Raf kinase inhibitor-like YbhB/YbcL family protein
MPHAARIRFLLVAACLAAGLAGCGSGGGSGDAATTTPPTTTAATTAPATTAAATTAAASGAFTLTSPAFADNAAIPRRFTCQGEGVSPELDWSGVPAGTTTLALLAVDPDAPVDNGFTHWVLTEIDPGAGKLAEGTTTGTAGDSSRGSPGYAGPCPPSGTHHYVFTLYALAAPPAAATREAIEAAAPQALGTAVLTGTYQQT